MQKWLLKAVGNFGPGLHISNSCFTLFGHAEWDPAVPRDLAVQRLGFVKKKVCVFSLGDTWLNMDCVNNKWVCLLAELQIPSVPHVKKAGTQQPFSTKLWLRLYWTVGEWRDVPTSTLMELVLILVGSSLGTRQLQLSKTAWNETTGQRIRVEWFLWAETMCNLFFLTKFFFFLIVFPWTTIHLKNTSR